MKIFNSAISIIAIIVGLFIAFYFIAFFKINPSKNEVIIFLTILFIIVFASIFFITIKRRKDGLEKPADVYRDVLEKIIWGIIYTFIIIALAFLLSPLFNPNG